MGKKQRTGNKSLQLTDDLIADIISRVPEKDLMRFTCVSKSWRSLINNTDDSYLSQLRSQRTVLLGRPFLVIEKRDLVSGDWVYNNYWLELDSIEDGNPNPRQLRNPFDGGRDTCVIGSCDGVLVLQQHSTYKMVVLNPTTKKHCVVPPNPAGDDNAEFIGFGYDSVHACYKLVTRIKHESRDDRVPELLIYNVNNCTWKKSRFDGLDYVCRFLLGFSGTCVDGALYWHVNWERETRKILCFVLADEEFHDVNPPYFDERWRDTFVTVFDGRLCLGSEDAENDRAEFWLMECDYKRQLGSSYSWRWTKFLSIVLDPEVCPHYGNPSPTLTPICTSACKNKILFHVDGYRLYWYDIGKNKFHMVNNRINQFSYSQVTSCVPSLVGVGLS